MLLSNTAGLSFLLGISCYSPASSACHLFISLKAMQMSYNKLPHKHWWLQQQNIFIRGSSVRKSKIKASVGLAPSTVFWEVSFFFFFLTAVSSSLVCFLPLSASARIPWLMATSLQSLPPSSCCLLCYVCLWVLFFSRHPAPDFIALKTFYFPSFLLPFHPSFCLRNVFTMCPALFWETTSNPNRQNQLSENS